MELSATERAKMTRLLGKSRASEIVRLAESSRAPMSEVTSHPGGVGMSKGVHLTKVTNPQTGKLERLTIDQLERMAMDAQIGSALDIIKLPILTIRPQLLHPEPEIEAFLNNRLDIDYASMMSDLLTALDYGFSAFELVFGRSDITITVEGNDITRDAVFYQKVKALHPRFSEFIQDEKGDIQGLEFGANGRNETVPLNKLMWFTHEGKFGNPYGNSRTRRAYQPWWWQQLIYQFANRYFEDQSIPQRKAFYEPRLRELKDESGNTTVIDENQAIALSIGEESKNGATVALPLQRIRNADGSVKYEKGWDIEFLDSGTKMPEFEAYLNHLDVKKLRGMFVPEKIAATTATGGGAYNMVESLADFFLMSEEALAGQLVSVICNRWAAALIQYNFGHDVPYPTYVLPKLSNTNKAFLQDFFKSFAHELFANDDQAPEIDLSAYADELGIPLKQLDEGVTEEGNTIDDNDTFLKRTNPIKLATPRKRRKWEQDTEAFKDELDATYDEWADRVYKRMRDNRFSSNEEDLDDETSWLLLALVTLYSARMLEAFLDGYGDDPVTPDGYRSLAEHLERKTETLETTTIPAAVNRIRSDLAGIDPEYIKTALESRRYIISQEGAGAYWSTIHRGFQQHEIDTGVSHKVRWVLDPTVEKHCEDCLRLAGEYPDMTALPTLPAMGDTKCHGNCRCWLEYEEGGVWRRV